MQTLKTQPAIKSHWIVIVQSLFHAITLVVCSVLISSLISFSAYAEDPIKQEASFSISHSNGTETQIEIYSSEKPSSEVMAQYIQAEINYSEINNIEYSYIALVNEDTKASQNTLFKFNKKIKSKNQPYYLTIPSETLTRHKKARVSINERINSSFAVFRSVSNGFVVGTTLFYLGADTPFTVALSAGMATGLISGAFQVFNQQHLNWQSYPGVFKLDRSKPISVTEYIAKYWVKEATIFLGLIAAIKYTTAYFVGAPITFDPAIFAFGIMAGATASTAFQGSVNAVIMNLRNNSLKSIKGRSIVLTSQSNALNNRSSKRQHNLSRIEKSELLEKIKLTSNFRSFLASVISVAITVPIATVSDNMVEQAMVSGALSILGVPAMIYLYKKKSKKISTKENLNFYNNYSVNTNLPSASLSCAQSLSI